MKTRLWTLGSLFACACALLSAMPAARKYYANWQHQRSIERERNFVQSKQWLVGAWVRDSSYDEPIPADWTYQDIFPTRTGRPDYDQYVHSKEFQHRYRVIHTGQNQHFVIYSNGYMTDFISGLPYWDQKEKRWRVAPFPKSLLASSPPNATYKIVGMEDDFPGIKGNGLKIQVDSLQDPKDIPDEFRGFLHYTTYIRAFPDRLERRADGGAWVTWNRIPVKIDRAILNRKKQPTNLPRGD